VIAKGKLGPGQMLAVDLKPAILLDTDAIDDRSSAAPVQAVAAQGVHAYLQTRT
jgi:hypothetical protein